MKDIPGFSCGDNPAASRPLLVYDGDCAFCAIWVRYWQQLTGKAVEYRPYQEVAAQYPAIAVSEFQRASQYITPDGHYAGAAEASFRVLSHAPGKGFWLWLYQELPGFAAVSEFVYSIIAAHRSAAYRATLILWGRNYRPPQYGLAAFLFTRLFGLIYLAAFVSFGVQALGLIGSHGILPLKAMLDTTYNRIGPDGIFEMPMLFWLNASDFMIQAVCWAGAAFSLLVTFNLLPRLSLFLCYLLYLSLLYAGNVFMFYQWDTFLLEGGFLTLLLNLAPRPGIWLLRWLLFRFMFMSGVVKLSSGDPNWWNLSALSYHFLTQPLPTPFAWHAAHLSAKALAFATGATFAVELVLPFLIFFPRRLRFLAGFGMLLLESLISITGNYNWFNLQTMLLCLLLFDDAAIEKLLSQRLAAWVGLRLAERPLQQRGRITIAVLASLILFCSLVQMEQRFGGEPPAMVQAVNDAIEPLHIVSGYGLFAVMTTKRDEIVIQGSADGTHWRDYEFKYKPGDVTRAPPWNIPYQPRLDWQMWFAALDSPDRLPWFWRFVQKLLENDPAVTSLLRTNPFANQPAPQFIRAQFYEYTYSSTAEKAKGIWWDRRLLGLYFPAARLNPSS
ncbi:MAG TPA: lipase maturation factor family protein [Rhizomicrobium sp.]|nr:lipase maturation factor family protein [Rhizomicrobium sp.]